MEVFKTLEIEGLERYQISNKGRVVSNGGKEPRFLKPQTDKLGYQHVRLYPTDSQFGEYPNGRGKIPKLEKVHRLVATHFISYPDDSETWCVNHIDGDKTNNSVENLQWVTHAENIQHSWDIGLRDNAAEKAAIQRRKAVKVTFKDGREEYYVSQTHAALALNTFTGTIAAKIKLSENGSLSFGTKGYRVERISELPPGETFKTILGIEEKLLKFREKYYGSEKRKQYRREYNKKKKEERRKNKDK